MPTAILIWFTWSRQIFGPFIDIKKLWRATEMSVTFVSFVLKIPKVSIKIFHMAANIDVAAVAINVFESINC